MHSFDYSSKSDDELCRLFGEKEELRPEARTALEEELRKRHIGEEEIARTQEDARNQAAALRRKQKKAGGPFGGMIQDGRKTLHWWAAYKRQTGSWPWPSVAASVMNWVVIFSGGLFLIWLADEWHFSRWQFFGLFLLVGLPYIAIEEWTKRKVKLHLLRDVHRASRQHRERTVV